MGVLDRTKKVTGLAGAEETSAPYICLSCDTEFEVQHHSCPVCGSFDLRYSKWVRE